MFSYLCYTYFIMSGLHGSSCCNTARQSGPQTAFTEVYMEQNSPKPKKKPSLRARMKKDFHEELAKLKPMSFSDKLSYIWEYYKVHIIVIVALIAFIVSISKVIYRNAKYESIFHCAVVNNMFNSAEESYIIGGFGDYIDIDKEHETLTFDSSYYFFWDNSSYSDTNYTSRLKVAAALGAKTLDAFIADSTYVDSATPEGQFLDLSVLLPADLYETVKPYLYYSKDADGNEHPYAVDLTSTHLKEAGILYQEPPLYAIVSNSQHIDTAIEFLKYAFSVEK